jgi:RsiW-degrading membrane proteinase PrsW (M82 family)
MIEPAKIAASLLPVFVFLIALVFLDSYKLMTYRSVSMAIGAGCVTALVCLVVNSYFIDVLSLPLRSYSRYVAPVIEESLKAIFIIYLMKRRQIGFAVDAAIYGFAVGAGFALVENGHYLLELEDSNIVLWLIRGFGTAVVHSGTTAIFAIVAKGLSNKRSAADHRVIIPSLLLAMIVHSAFNHFVFSPIVNTMILLVMMPLIVIIVFERSERSTRSWLGAGMDADMELLESIVSGKIRETRIGQYLERLKDRFPGEVLGDMLCLLRIHTELALGAKGILLARKTGMILPPDQDTKDKFSELSYLEKNIGKTGRLAILPLIHSSSRNLWKIYWS